MIAVEVRSIFSGGRNNLTVRTGIIENATWTSRIPPIWIKRGGELSERSSFSPPAETIDLTKRGNSNVLATFSIISSSYGRICESVSKTK